MSNLLICDIDGVLADCSHRLHYLEEKNYEKFYGDEMLDDKLIATGSRLLYGLWNRHVDANSMYTVSTTVIFLTGRPNRTRVTTTMWLRGKLNVTLSNYPLIMRGDGDYRPSPIVKTELLRACGAPFREYEQIYFIDDDPENVKAVCKAFPHITGITFGIGRMKP